MPEQSHTERSQTEQSETKHTQPAAPVLPRRRRYARAPSPAAVLSLTPTKTRMLLLLAELRFLSLPQIARLCCPTERRNLSEKSARRQMRALFDAGLVDVLPVSRAALAPSEAPNDASLLYGSAPNVYAPTAAGLDALCKAGLRDREPKGRTKPAYGPKNSLFLAHELAVRDVRVWLEEVAREGGYALEAWHDGKDAAIDLVRTQAPYQVRPDAWFVLRLGQAVLVGLVEVDRGTERGDRRWGEKLASYEMLFASGQLPNVTGYVNARVLVITPDIRRRDLLAGLIADRNGTDQVMPIATRCWISSMNVLTLPSLSAERWRQPGSSALRPLVPH